MGHDARGITPRREGRRAGTPTVVVLRALGLGDFLTGVPALRALAEAFCDHRIVLAAPGVLAPLVRLCGGVDELCDLPGLGPLHPALRRPKVAVDLHGHGPASRDLLADLAPGRLVAFADPHSPTPTNGPTWRADEHEVTRWCRLLTESGIPADPARLDLSRPAGRPRWPDRPTVIHPGAPAPARRWPAERFGAVAAVEAASGRRVVVTAGPGEVELASAVVTEAAAQATKLGQRPPVAVRAVRTEDLGQLATVVASAARVVCGDTGVAHLATALCTPSVVLFGPVPPERRGPPPDRWWHVALWAGHHGNPHGATVDPGLLEIGVADVLIALARPPDPDPVPDSGSRRLDPHDQRFDAARTSEASPLARLR